MSQWHTLNNIYHGGLPVENAEDSQISLPVQYAPVGGSRVAHVENELYLPPSDGYPDARNRQRQLLPIHPGQTIYTQGDYGMHQGINMGGQGHMLATQYQETAFLAHLDQRYMADHTGVHVEAYQPGPDNSMPYMFPQHGLAHLPPFPTQLDTGHSPVPHSSNSYNEGEVALDTSMMFESETPDGQPLPDPGEFLRVRLGLKHGEPISLWSLPEPEPGRRPPHSYPLLVRLAIYSSPNGQLTLKQIYEALEERFEYYRDRPTGAWKGSIRHNLSLNKVFKIVHRPLTEPGKGNYWAIDHSKGEGYKRDRKRKRRRNKGAKDKSRSDDDEDDDGPSGCEIDFGMVESDHSDSSNRPSSASSHRRESSRASRYISPYSSPSSAPPRRLDGASSLRMPSSGDYHQLGYESGGSSSSSGIYPALTVYNGPPSQAGMGNLTMSSSLPESFSSFFNEDTTFSPESAGYVSSGG